MTAQAEQIAGRDGEGAGRRPALDGLRAVAVGLVVAFHCSVDALDGGFVGVDVFFVLSGYLVTGVLLRDRELHGRIRFGRFYARRVRRLLPASVVTLLVSPWRSSRSSCRRSSWSDRRAPPGPPCSTWRTGSSSASRPTTSPTT